MLFKRYIVFSLLLTIPVLHILGQEQAPADSSKIEKAIAKIDKLTAGEALQAWHVTEASAIELPTSPDTLHLNYQTATTPVYKKYIAAEWLGNLGLPAQSAVFAERPTVQLTGDNIFLIVVNLFKC